MRKAIPYAVREKIVERRQGGEPYKSISEDLGYSESAIRKIWYRYQKEGEKAFRINYSNCGRSSGFKEEVRAAVEELRDNQQGGSYIHSKLKLKYPHLPSPSARTLQRWWKKAGTNRQRGQPSRNEKKGGVSIHTKRGK